MVVVLIINLTNRTLIFRNEIIEVVAARSKSFCIRGHKTADLFRQITASKTWQTVEINYKLYEVASLAFTRFFEKKNYRLIIMREKGKNNQMDLFTGDTFVYRSIWQMTGKAPKNKLLRFIIKGEAPKNSLMWWTTTLAGNTCLFLLWTKIRSF